jgi:hypothetical protein
VGRQGVDLYDVSSQKQALMEPKKRSKGAS